MRMVLRWLGIGFISVALMACALQKGVFDDQARQAEAKVRAAETAKAAAKAKAEAKAAPKNSLEKPATKTPAVDDKGQPIE